MIINIMRGIKLVAMNIEILNPHVIKILIAARREDSVNAIAKRTGLSYGWAYHWVQALAEEGVFVRRGRKMALSEKNRFYKFVLSFIRNNFSSVKFYYYALQLFGVKHCFTKTDAVYVWTQGGYNIARYRDYYPVFIKIRKSDYSLFRRHCRKLGLKIGAESGIFYSVELMDEFAFDVCDGIPVDSLEETIAYMKKNIYNFEPALEMVHEMYGTEKHGYREAETDV